MAVRGALSGLRFQGRKRTGVRGLRVQLEIPARPLDTQAAGIYGAYHCGAGIASAERW